MMLKMLIWALESCLLRECMDFRGFQIAAKYKSSTRRGLLSSVYDPLGLAAPFILEECIVMQRLCKQKRAWDEPLE